MLNIGWEVLPFMHSPAVFKAPLAQFELNEFPVAEKHFTFRAVVICVRNNRSFATKTVILEYMFEGEVKLHIDGFFRQNQRSLCFLSSREQFQCRFWLIIIVEDGPTWVSSIGNLKCFKSLLLSICFKSSETFFIFIKISSSNLNYCKTFRSRTVASIFQIARLMAVET